MKNSEIRIFYSWQSDLPASQTRNIIEDGINSAVKSLKDVVTIVADRDTKGEYGTPDITETIFSKINECDIFVADISIINKYNSIDDDGNVIKDVKTAPNPNVLLELGYAAKTVNWENVICIMNTDFGEREELPFDLKQRRPYAFSLKSMEKSDVKKEIRDIVACTVMNLLENGKRSKGDFSVLKVGMYDIENNVLEKTLKPIVLSHSNGYKNLRDSLLIKAKKLVEEISLVKLKNIEVSEGISTNKVTDPKNIPEILSVIYDYHPVEISAKKTEEMKKNVKNYLGIDIDDSFFCMGELKNKHDMLNKEILDGTDEEINKYHKYNELTYIFGRIELLDSYVESFEGMYLIPLAIRNTSSYMDKNINVTVYVDEETEIIVPNETLFNQEILGMEGYVVKEGILKQLFMMQQTENINYEEDISYDRITAGKMMVESNTNSFINFNSYAKIDIEDYGREIKNYIASPLEERKNVFEYKIENLRAKETKWLGAAILINKTENNIKISYKIKSDNSNGELAGELYNLDN